MCDANIQCQCQIAVKNAYRQLRNDGVADLSAFNTATTIFRYHHPEKTLRQARITVSEWLADDAGLLH